MRPSASYGIDILIMISYSRHETQISGRQGRYDMHASVPIIRAKGEGDKQSFLGGGLHTWKLMAEDTDGAFFLFEDALSEGKTTPLHRHPDSDETVYVLEGEILVNVDGNESRVGTGG